MRSALLALVLFAAAVWLTRTGALAGDTENPWAKVTAPSKGESRAIGGYAGGCLAGAATLPLEGRGFQVVRPKRGRNYGHPDLVATIEDLGAAVAKARLGALMIADLSQPRGGLAPGGHSSHQSGLDVNIWFWAPDEAGKRKLTVKEREALESRDMVNAKTNKPTAHWSPRVRKLLELAAADKRVSRIFVHPAIKKKLCAQAGKDRDWLRKIRPWWGHNEHFHMRLACPADSPDCVPQADNAEGDGCKELDWWLSEKSQKERAEGRAKYRQKQVTLPDLPAPCAAVLADE